MPERANAGQFRSGQSGNPKGKKPGTGKVAKLRKQIEKHVPAIIKRLAEAAIGGDVASARLLIERVIPPMKAAEESVSLVLPDGKTLTEQGRAVLSAVADGELAPGQGAALIASLGTFAKIEEADEMRRRIEALEAKQKAPGGEKLLS